MGLWPSHTLLTPLHVHGARTAEEYRAMQRRAITSGKAARPALNWRDPVPAVPGRAAFVSGGKWIVQCECGNGPSADPEWHLALCFECGAIYEQVAFPVDRLLIQALLLQRPQPSTRHWLIGESVADLERDNVARGVAI